MRIKEAKIYQQEKLKEICMINDVDYKSLEILLESVRSKKVKRNNYHQKNITDTIEKAIK